ncbi:MAG: hypothetical protein ACRC17_03480 [Culicoidibacterales bacterium]
MIFNIYYMNFSKVYEIKMMLSNAVSTDRSHETSDNEFTEAKIEAKMGIAAKIFNIGLGSNISSQSNASEKIVENFKMITTKSMILNEVNEQCKSIQSFKSEKIVEGQLIKIDNVSLTLTNETELRSIKMLSNGMLKGVTIPEAQGLDVNNFIDSIFKDYSYKLEGSILGESTKLMIKIPLTFENEFENMYNIDDLCLGNVSIIGIYKGKIVKDKLKTSFDFFKNQGTNPTPHETSIQSSNFVREDQCNETADEDLEYHYIDLLAIVQILNPSVNKRGDN